jgi:hypothetical protein
MTLLESLPQKLGSVEAWVEKGGVRWLDPGQLSVRELCMEMIAAHARFITITAYQLPKDEGIRLEYHWDLMGTLLGFPFLLETEPGENPKIESIFDLTAAVDWIEREIHAGDTLGVNLREIADICKPETGAPGQEEVKK